MAIGEVLDSHVPDDRNDCPPDRDGMESSFRAHDGDESIGVLQPGRAWGISRVVCGRLFSFRACVEDRFREYHYSNKRSMVLIIACVGVGLNIYKIALGTVLRNVGREEFQQFEDWWDFYLWSCPRRSVVAATVVIPVLEGGACLAVAAAWPYVYADGRPVIYRRNLNFAFLAALVATVFAVLFSDTGPLGMCASGQLCLILFIFIMPLRPLVMQCVACCLVAFLGFFIRLSMSGIECIAVFDGAVSVAVVLLVIVGTVAADERVERAHFVAVEIARASHETLLGLVDRMLPPVMAAQLVEQWGGHVAISKSLKEASVLFVELRLPDTYALPTLLDLNKLFTLMDGIVDTVRGTCKIETVGGQFVCASGVPSASEDHARTLAELALRIRAALSICSWSDGSDVEFRIGMHSGPIGVRRFYLCPFSMLARPRPDSSARALTPITSVAEAGVRREIPYTRMHTLTRANAPRLRACVPACSSRRSSGDGDTALQALW